MGPEEFAPPYELNRFKNVWHAFVFARDHNHRTLWELVGRLIGTFHLTSALESQALSAVSLDF